MKHAAPRLAERISTMPMTDPQSAANPTLFHKLLFGQEIAGLQAGLGEHTPPDPRGRSTKKYGEIVYNSCENSMTLIIIETNT
jgi:hypothetical protein